MATAGPMLGLCGCLALLLFPALIVNIWNYKDRMLNTVHSTLDMKYWQRNKPDIIDAF